MVCAALLFATLTAAPPLAVLQGRVLGPDGKPARGALVAAVTPAGEWSAQTTARSDAAGHFRLAVKPGRYSLTATLPGFREAFVSGLAAEAGPQAPEQTLQLGAGGHRVTGSLVDARGKPVKSGLVGFGRVGNDEGDLFVAHMNGERFDVTLGPGTYVLQARAPGMLQLSEQLVVEADVVAKTVQLHLGPTAAGPEVKAWIKANAVPLASVEAGQGFKDLEPLEAAVGKARVVSLGEATHGTREFFQLKHRLFEFLVEKLGFTVFAIEANMPEARKVNEYVLEGKGDPAAALAGLYFWTWNTEEVLDLVRWMRRYNEDPAHARKVKFYGFDLQTGTVAAANTRAWLARVDPAQAAWFDANLKSPTADAGRELLARFDANQAAWVKATSEEAFAWARQDARVLVQSVELAQEKVDPGVRDRCMAENVEWILAHEPGARMMIWAHNLHVAVDSAVMRAPSMGVHLRQALGQDLLVLGFVFREGGFRAVDGDRTQSKGLTAFEVAPNPAATLADALASAGPPLLALDLRRLPARGPVRDWFDRSQGAFNFGAMFDARHEDAFVLNAEIAKEYDGLLFVEKTTAAKGLGALAGGAPAASCPGAPTNLGFEDGKVGELPAGWSMAQPMRDDGFLAALVEGDAKEGARALHLRHATGTSGIGWATAVQKVSAAPYRGKKVRLEGFIRTDGKPESHASFWFRVDREQGVGFFDNAQARAVSSTEWTALRIEGQVAEDATCLAFGAALWGAGSARFDALTLRVVE